MKDFCSLIGSSVDMGSFVAVGNDFLVNMNDHVYNIFGHVAYCMILVLGFGFYLYPETLRFSRCGCFFPRRLWFLLDLFGIAVG
jgi:hypothetical protein